MELALIIGAFAMIAALIALCTFWFYNLHRRYLVLEENTLVPVTAENDYSSSAPARPQGEEAEEDRGKKLLGTTCDWERKGSLSPWATEDGKNSPFGITRAQAIDDSSAQRADEGRILLAKRKESQQESPIGAEEVQNQTTEEKISPREAAITFGETRPAGEEETPEEPSGQLNHQPVPALQPESQSGVDEEKKKTSAAEKPETMCSQPNPVEAAPVETSEGGDRLMDPLVRAEVVIGEGTKQLLIETNVTLERPAIKIRNITAEIRNLTTELIQDKIIIQGVLHKQIFYVGEDNIVHHQAEDVPFSTFIDIFGTEPGMNVQVHPVIETILFSLLRPTLLHQKVVVEFFVKVTESNQLNLVEGTGPLVRLDQVIGEGTKQELIENTITLNAPALKIDDITAEIRDLSIEVIDDKVIIQGIIHKQIFFIGLDNIEYHQAEDLEFSTFLDIPGATTGMDVVVEPTIEFIHFELLDENTLLQKVVVEFFVKVTESIQINVALGPGALLKLDTVVGEDTKQLLVENTITLSQPAIKIREIVAKVERLMAEVIEDKVIIQGVVHKQIFFINEDNLEIHQSEDVPFSTFVDIPGAVPGMDVRIKPVIETVLFELLDSTTLRQKVVVELFIKVTESQQLQVQVAAPYGPYYF
ncbi:MAG TPA: SPOCS domain-containing protein [Capillibacterium sp.]